MKVYQRHLKVNRGFETTCTNGSDDTRHMQKTRSDGALLNL